MTANSLFTLAHSIARQTRRQHSSYRAAFSAALKMVAEMESRKPRKVRRNEVVMCGSSMGGEWAAAQASR